MTASNAGTKALAALSSAGVTALVHVPREGLPGVVYWGRELPALDADQATTLLSATEVLPSDNELDVSVRLALLPEHSSGWTGRPGLSGSRSGVAWSTRFTTASATLQGLPVDGFASIAHGSLHVESHDREAGLDLALRIEMLPAGLLRSRATLTNHGSDPYAVEDLVLAYPVPAEASEILDFAGRWGRERVPQRSAFSVGTHLRENRKGRTGADSAYLLHAGTPGFGFADGEVFAVHTAFSGNHTHYAERVFTGQRVIGGGELLLAGEVVLGGGGSYESPWVYAAYGNGLDEVARRFHGHLRGRPRPVTASRPVTLNVWEAVYFDHDEARLRALADSAAALGVERFVLDDGWFGARRHERAGLGDWVVSPEVWPDGLHPLVDHVRALGMEFGLWFEPEMVNPDSDVARAHPEWIMSARSQWPIESRYQQVLNLGIPGAYAHVKNQIFAILDEYAIGYIKWDHNRDLIEAGTRPEGGRPGVHAQTHAFYRLLDEIRTAFPELEIESCSSGGARVDLGVLEHTDRVWVSDNIDPLDRQQMLRWTTQLVPPEFMGSHIASGRSHTTGRVHDLGFRAATAVFGHLGIEWDLAQATQEELRELRLWIDFYKANRDLLLAGDVVRMDRHDDNLLVHGVVAPSGARAIFAVVAVGSLEAVPGARLRFRGLEPTSAYRVRPLIVGTPPFRLQAPTWWFGTSAEPPSSAGYRPFDTSRDYPGAVFTGLALAHVGVAAPILRPEQALLFEATRVTGA